MKKQFIENVEKFLQQKEYKYIGIDSPYLTSVRKGFLPSFSKIQISISPIFNIIQDLDANFYYDAIKEIGNKEKYTLQDIVKTVTNVVNNKLGVLNISDPSQRLKMYHNEDNSSKLSAFFNKNISQCSERHIAANNLFNVFGIECYFVTGPININGVGDFHQYLIVNLEESFYIYDLAVCPTKEVNGKIVKNPLTKKLTQQEVNEFKLSSQNENLFLENRLESVEFYTSKGNRYQVRYGSYRHHEKEVNQESSGLIL